MPASAPDASPRARALVEDLAAIAPRPSPADRAEKIRLPGALAGRRTAHPQGLLRFHEALCLLQASPDDQEGLTRGTDALAAFPARVSRLDAAPRRRLDGSGMEGSSLDYPFGLPMARWLAARYPRDELKGVRRTHLYQARGSPC